MKHLLTSLFAGFALLATPVLAQDNAGGQVGESVLTAEDAVRFKKPGYSPYAGRGFPTRVFWGDTHLHTNLSLDARAFGVLLGPEEAYRLARGEEVTSTHGERVKLSRPLDWLVVSDHSDGMGAMVEIVRGNPTLLADPTLRDWHNRVNQGGQTALGATMEVINAFTQGNLPKPLLSKQFANSIWDQYLRTAEKFNEPGRFTAIIGYEWTSTEDGNNLHRNVLYRDGQVFARQMLRTPHRKASTRRISGPGCSVTKKSRAGASWPSPITATSPTASCFRSRRTRPPANR